MLEPPGRLVIAMSYDTGRTKTEVTATSSVREIRRSPTEIWDLARTLADLRGQVL